MAKNYRDKMVDRIVTERLKTCSEGYFEEILKEGFRGFYDLSDEELELEMKEILAQEEFEGSIKEFLVKEEKEEFNRIFSIKR